MRIVFLSYLNRSGSTYLATRLNRYSDIVVGLETKIKDGIYKGKEVYLHNESDLDEYLKHLKADIKYASWGVDDQKLKKRIINNHKFPITFKEILYNSFLEMEDDDDKIFIHKNGHYLFHYNRTKKIFPKAKFIYVRRDPRAIFNSQKKSIDSTKHTVMQTDVVKFALSIKYSYSKVDKLINNPDVYLVFYESLLKNEVTEISKILTFIDSDGCISKDKYIPYSNRIPNEQKHLHKNISSNPDLKRIDSWKSDLSDDEIVFINNVLSKELKSSGYSLQGCSHYININMVCMYLRYYAYRYSGIYKLYKILNRYL